MISKLESNDVIDCFVAVYIHRALLKQNVIKSGKPIFFFKSIHKVDENIQKHMHPLTLHMAMMAFPYCWSILK